MTAPSSLHVLKGRQRHDELGTALILPGEDPDAAVMLQDRTGSSFYRPLFRNFVQARDGFNATFGQDGTLTLYLEAVQPETLTADRPASPLIDDVRFELVLQPDNGGVALPLQCHREGQLLRLSAQLEGEPLRIARTVLFDAEPNAVVRVTQALTLAARQTEAFIQRQWQDPTIRASLLALFGGIPFSTPSSYFGMATRADPDFGNQYLLLDCVYTTNVAVPSLPGYIQWQVEWQGRIHNYYQDNQEREHVFYIPDGFTLSKGPSNVPSVALLQFSVPGDGSLEETRATFRFFGTPLLDNDRIENAKRVLSERLGLPIHMACIEDGRSSKKRFTQYLPNAQASSSAGIPLEQKAADIDLVMGLRHELDLNLSQLRALWAAIFSDAPERTLFHGWIDLELAAGRYHERIAFNGRLPPKSGQAFFDDIVDSGSLDTQGVDIDIETLDAVFEGSPPIAAITVMLQGRTTTLRPGKTRTTLHLERSLRDIVLGSQEPDRYNYVLQVVRADSLLRFDHVTEPGETQIWITTNQISGQPTH